MEATVLEMYPLSAFINADPNSDEGKRLVRDLRSAIASRLTVSPGDTCASEIVRELNAAGHKLQPIEVRTRGFSYEEEFADNKCIRIIGVDNWVTVGFTENMNSAEQFLQKYSGESVAKLIDLASKYRVDSIVLAFEEAISKKKKINDVERTILAIEALEREVNNGGYDQFFVNSSNEFASVIVAALKRIGCPRTAEITQKAVDALGISGEITAEAIESVMEDDDEEKTERLGKCDDLYYESPEPIAERLFKFIKKNRNSIKLRD